MLQRSWERGPGVLVNFLQLTHVPELILQCESKVQMLSPAPPRRSTKHCLKELKKKHPNKIPAVSWQPSCWVCPLQASALCTGCPDPAPSPRYEPSPGSPPPARTKGTIIAKCSLQPSAGAALISKTNSMDFRKEGEGRSGRDKLREIDGENTNHRLAVVSLKASGCLLKLAGSPCFSA